MLQVWEKCAITFFCVLVIGLAIWIYTLAAKTSSSTSPTISPTVSPTNAPGLPISAFKGVYLYSTVKNSLYLLTPDGKYYSCGQLAGCPNVLSQDTPSYEIADITRLYNCVDKSKIPDKYAKDCDGGGNGWITVVMQSADDLEKFIASNISGTITPPVDVCYTRVQVPGAGPGFFAKVYTGLEDFLATNGTTIGELAVLALAGKAEQSATEIVAFAGKWVGNFVLFGMVLQGFLGAYSGGSTWDRQKSWLMSGQILTHKVVGWIGERVAQLSKGEVSEMVETADGSIFDVAMQVGQKCVDSVLTEFSDIIGSMIAGASSLLAAVAVVQLLGMFLDMIDPCNLNDPANNLTQQTIDQVQQSSDMGLSINLHGLDKVPWDPTRNFCDFPLADPTTCDKQLVQCGAQGGAQSACTDAKAKFKQYQKQYLDSLTVNSYGQCIRKTPLSNKELAALFKKYVGGQINWDAIATIDKTNYTDALLPTSNTLRELDVMLVNGNAVVQVYANQYWWVLLIIGVVLIAMLMSV